MDELRLLDVDDLVLLRHLLDGTTVTAAALRLGLTQPAVTQRLRKIERVFGRPILERVGRRAQLSRDGRAIAEQAAAALSLLGAVRPGTARHVVTVGSRPEIGASWVWPVLLRLRARHPEHAFHCHIAAGDDLLRMLETGAVDLAVTSAPHVSRSMAAIELAREDYVCAAAPAIARGVRGLADLRDHTWIEHDRSFPFLRYLTPADRAALACREVWFVGSTTAMVSALAAGRGVGIVPRYLAAPALRTGKLRRILPGLALAHDRFRVVHRADRDADLRAAAALLAGALRRHGLR